jgi:hypothetical protein
MKSLNNRLANLRKKQLIWWTSWLRIRN